MKWRDVIYEQVTMVDLDKVRSFADSVFARVGISVKFGEHFIERLSRADAPAVSLAQVIRIFREVAEKHAKPIAQMGPDAEGVMKDLKTDVNVPFILYWDKENEVLELRAKTIMKKKDYTTPNKVFPIQ
jgi:hypothetical protein